MITAYKLFRLRNDGTLGSLFCNRRAVVPMFRWLKAEEHPTKGLALRAGWHCCAKPKAPHLKMKLANGEQRVWCLVRIDKFTKHQRPGSQGGLWYTAKRVRVTGRIAIWEDKT